MSRFHFGAIFSPNSSFTCVNAKGWQNILTFVFGKDALVDVHARSRCT